MYDWIANYFVWWKEYKKIIPPILVGILFQSFLDLLSNDYEMAFPIIFSYERDTPESKAISTDLKRFYLGEGQVENTTQTREGIEGLYADGIIGFTVNRGVKLISAKSKEDTYYYCFTYKGKYSFFYLPDSDNVTIGKFISIVYFCLLSISHFCLI